MISVAMTTYNGEKYIIKQLESLKNQSMRIDEVIIYDDCSNDKTYDVVQKYIYDNKLLGWKIKRQPENVGWRRNFYTAIGEASGEYIFLSDQDDVWAYNKVQEMISALEENHDINVLCCVANFIDQFGNKILLDKKSLPFGKRKGNKIIKASFDNKFIYSIMPGCTMAVRKKYAERAMACSYEDSNYILPHDALFWKLGVLTESAYVLNEELISYRIHAENASSPAANMNHKIKSIEERKKEIKQNRHEMIIIKKVYRDFSSMTERNDNDSKLDDLIDFCKIRELLITNELNVLNVIFSRNLGYYRDVRMLVGDLCAKHCHKGEKFKC